jgi:CRISPR system Cascade subunit CasD
LEHLDENLRFAVRVDEPGVVGTDYHTVSGYHRTAAGGFRSAVATQTFKSLEKAMEHCEATVVSPRDYLHDARFLVALASDDERLLRQLAGESLHPEWPGDLRRPKWPVYLGRKSCVPTRPVLPVLKDVYDSPQEALEREPWDPPKNGSRIPAALDAWVECRRGDPEWHQSRQVVERQDAMRVSPGRFYAFRYCRYVSIPTSSLTRES